MSTWAVLMITTNDGDTFDLSKSDHKCYVQVRVKDDDFDSAISLLQEKHVKDIFMNFKKFESQTRK